MCKIIASAMGLPAPRAGQQTCEYAPSANREVFLWNNNVIRGLEVYDRNLNFMWQLPLGYGHSDLVRDANRDEVLVVGYYDAESNTGQINKYRLSDGKETRLLEHDWQFCLHASCRNEQKTGWCFISTYDGEARLTDDATSWLPFGDEVFALKLDGSGEV